MAFFTVQNDPNVVSVEPYRFIDWGSPSVSYTGGAGAPSGDLGVTYYFDVTAPYPYLYEWNGASWDGVLPYISSGFEPSSDFAGLPDSPGSENIQYWVQISGAPPAFTVIGIYKRVSTTDYPSDGHLIAWDGTEGEWIIETVDQAVGGAIQAAVDSIVDAAPAALDTLNELAAALNDDANFASTVTNALAGKAALAAANAFTVGGHTITSAAIGSVPLTLTGAAGQTANLFEVKESGGTSRFTVSDAGYTTTANTQSAGGVRVGTAVSYTTNQKWVSVDNAASVPSAVSSGAIMYADGGHLFARSVDANVGLTRQVINPQTGTAYTLVAGDAGALVTLSNAAAITLTVPAEASVNYAVGTRIDLAQIGAGQVTVAGDAGVTVGSADAKLALRVQYSSASLVKTGADTWLLVGDLA
jgi:hypothetical protein